MDMSRSWRVVMKFQGAMRRREDEPLRTREDNRRRYVEEKGFDRGCSLSRLLFPVRSYDEWEFSNRIFLWTTKAL